MIIPDLQVLRKWLDQLQYTCFECDSCEALHLPHMQNLDGVFDAKIDILDDTLVFSALAEVRPTAIIPLMANLSQINASSLLVKTFMDIQDSAMPKLVVCYSVPLAAGLTFEQFSLYLQQMEEQVGAVVFELFSNNMLFDPNDTEPEPGDESEEEGEESFHADDAPSPVIH